MSVAVRFNNPFLPKWANRIAATSGTSADLLLDLSATLQQRLPVDNIRLSKEHLVPEFLCLYLHIIDRTAFAGHEKRACLSELLVYLAANIVADSVESMSQMINLYNDRGSSVW